jgi:CubicO group peptidase (beta-lactamase class C family)
LKDDGLFASITLMFRHAVYPIATLFLLVSFNASVAQADGADEYILGQMEQRRIPGLCLAVVKDGKVIKEKAYGLANVELNVPVTTNTVFEIGSITKQFTATLIMRLVADGKLSLDDRLHEHLNDTPETWREINVRHLLTHTSGLKNYTGLDGFEVRQKLNCDAFVRQLAREPLEFTPGERYSYCNSGYNLLGYLIELKSGTNYWTVLRERILSPLGMNHTRSRDATDIVTNRASGYEVTRGKLTNRDSDLTDVFAAGAMVSTIGDLLKWNAALGSDRLLKAASREAMWKPVKLNSGGTHPYGLGFRVEDYKGRANIGHSGSTSGFSSSLQRFPEERVAVIVLCNFGEQGMATKIARGLADLYFEVSSEAGDEKP